MRHKVIPQNIYLAALFFLLSCGQTSSDSSTATEDSSSSKAGATDSPVFQLNTTPPPERGGARSNWCYAQYGESLVVNAEKLNSNRRYFFLPAGVTKVVVGNSAKMTLLLKPLPNGNVAIYSGANYPDCLSQSKNLHPAGGASAMRYNNGNKIDFNIDMMVDNTKTRITLEFPPGVNYGISVNHCLECQ